jgi:hypothetical protein
MESSGCDTGDVLAGVGITGNGDIPVPDIVGGKDWAVSGGGSGS